MTDNRPQIAVGQAWKTPLGNFARVAKVDDQYVWYEIEQFRGICPCDKARFVEGSICVAENTASVADLASFMDRKVDEQ